jgi:hypothetical protein
MDTPSPFKWRHFEGDVILLCVRWYLRYALSYRDVEELALERGHQWTTRPCFAGYSAMPLSWTGGVGRSSKRRMIHTASMKRTSR